MEIEKTTKYNVGSHQFASEEEAVRFLKRQSDHKEVFEFNEQALSEDEREYIPVFVENNCDIFTKCGDSNIGYYHLSLNGDRELKYYEEKIEILSSSEFFDELDGSGWYIAAKSFNNNVVALLKLAEDIEDFDYKKILEVLSEIYVEPQIEYID